MPGQHREHQGEPVAVDAGGRPPRRDDLGRGDQRLDLDQQRPRPLHRAEHDGAGRRPGLADEARRGVRDLDQAALAHLEDAHLAGRAEAVLQRSQGAEAALALALEVEHAVDQVLERPRPRERSPPWSRGRSGSGVTSSRLAVSSSGRGRLAERRRRCPERRVGDRRASAPSRSRRPPAARIRARRAPPPARARRASARRAPPRRGARRAAGPGRRIPRRRRRGRRCPPAARLASAIPARVLLPIPGAPPSRTSEPGTRPPPRTRSSSAMPGAEARRALGRHVAQWHRLRPGSRDRARPPARAPAGRAHLLERVPGAAARALPGPGEGGMPALRAAVLRSLRGHPLRLGMAPDASRADRDGSLTRKVRFRPGRLRPINHACPPGEGSPCSGTASGCRPPCARWG